MQIEGLRRGVHGWQGLVAEPVFDGAYECGGFACGPEDGIDEEARGGFAVGTGDSGERQLHIEPVVEVTGCQGESVPPVRNLEPGTVELFGSGQLAGDGNRSFRKRLGGKLTSVGVCSREGEKEVSGL